MKISPRKRKGLYIKIQSEIVGVHVYPLQLSARLCKLSCTHLLQERALLLRQSIAYISILKSLSES